MTESIERKSKQKRVLYLLFGCVTAVLLLFIGFISVGNKEPDQKLVKRTIKNPLPSIDESFSEEKLRLSQVEIANDALTRDLKRLEERMIEMNENNTLLNQKNASLEEKTTDLQSRLKEALEEQKEQPKREMIETAPEKSPSNVIHVWGSKYTLHTQNVREVIPAGTVVKCILVSAADCSVGVNSGSDPRAVLLQPVKNGHLPKNVRVALKGARIIGHARGDIASERVYIRTESMTLMAGGNGDFVNTSMTGFVSGEDGKEGVRGSVVDRSGSIILRAGAAAFLGGITDGIEAALNNQTIAKLSRTSESKSLLNVDTFRSAGAKGMNTSLSKLSEYYIKRAEQMQPVIQIAAGRVVDVVFLKSVKIGEKNIQKRIEEERQERAGKT